MNREESKMKQRGQERVWSVIKTKSGNIKTIPSTQIGQQIIFDDVLRIMPLVRDWIEEKSASSYRRELQDYFINDEILSTKITECLLLLSSSTYITDFHTKGIQTRHKKVSVIRDRLMPQLSFDQVWRFLEVVIEFSDYFEVRRDLLYVEGKTLWNMRYVCTLSETILNKLAVEAHIAFFPEPMSTPPINWSYCKESGLKGGYIDYQYELVRATSFKVDYSKYAQNIFDSVNYIQSVPWKINGEMYEIVKRDLKCPQKEDFVKSSYPDVEASRWDVNLDNVGINFSQKEIDEIKRARIVFGEQVEIYRAEAGDFESALGKYRAVRLALGIAEHYLEEDVIYFPHSYDFRGRIYPLPVGLSPQGSDAVKSLLEYKRGQRLTQSGEDWCWAYLATLFGDDKISFEERIERGKELIDVDYLEADEPFQFLAHQLELKKYLANNNYEVRARIHLDACNSGSQFASVITGDRAGCIATNVIPTILEDGSQLRQDAYMLVANKSLELTRTLTKACGDKEKKKILRFFESRLEESGRKICKQPVMVSNYGGTAGGRADIIWDVLREMGVDRRWITKKNTSLFSKIIGDSIAGVLNGGKAFEQYIQKMNNLIAKKNHSVEWVTADGFWINHVKKKELKRKQVSCIIPGSRRLITINKKIFSEDVSISKMKSAISPNYIHSLDAELLRRVALRMQSSHIMDSDWIHDSFGCHPNNVEHMLLITKEEFRDLAKREPLTLLDHQLRRQVDKSKSSQKSSAEIKLPKLKGFDIKKGDADEVMNSNWFFS